MQYPSHNSIKPKRSVQSQLLIYIAKGTSNVKFCHLLAKGLPCPTTAPLWGSIYSIYTAVFGDPLLLALECFTCAAATQIVDNNQPS